MRTELVLEDIRVQSMKRSGGGRSYTIVWPSCRVDEGADGYLRTHEGSGSQKTYAPKMLPDGARPELLEAVNTALDEMVVT
ncbi:hypothetical protein ACFRAO_06445 [Streptomyces sp. NPDC056656]|uniref:hypothetical protein n=1 Tax=Streptomyces sp. NPDC056656 TaxID=3345895 RepID=UPI003691F96D